MYFLVGHYNSETKEFVKVTPPKESDLAEGMEEHGVYIGHGHVFLITGVDEDGKYLATEDLSKDLITEALRHLWNSGEAPPEITGRYILPYTED